MAHWQPWHFKYLSYFHENIMAIKEKAIALGVIIIMNVVVFALFGPLSIIAFVASLPLAFAILKR